MEDFLERAGVRLHWVEWAPAQPDEGDGVDVFALHGLSSNALYWARLAQRLPHRRLVALDQRAHGASQAPATGYRMEDLSGDVAFALSSLALARPAVLGHSWGGSVALDLAATHLEEVGGLGLIDSPILPMSERMTWEQAAQVMQPPLPRYASLDEAYDTSRRLLGLPWGADLEPFVAAPEDVVARVLETGANPLAAGDGSLRFCRLLEGAGVRVAEAGSTVHVVRALHVCRLAADVPPVPPEAVLPTYLRAPDARPAS